MQVSSPSPAAKRPKAANKTEAIVRELERRSKAGRPGRTAKMLASTLKTNLAVIDKCLKQLLLSRRIKFRIDLDKKKTKTPKYQVKRYYLIDECSICGTKLVAAGLKARKYKLYCEKCGPEVLRIQLLEAQKRYQKKRNLQRKR